MIFSSFVVEKITCLEGNCCEEDAIPGSLSIFSKIMILIHISHQLLKASSHISENPCSADLRRLALYFEKGFLFVLYIAFCPFQHLTF